METDPDIDLVQFDDDVHTIPQQISNATTTNNIISNRELLSKLISF